MAGARPRAGDGTGPGAAVAGWVDRRARRTLGGPGRLRVVLLLAAVLGLNTADTGTIGASAAQLEADLEIGHAQLGLLASASAGVGVVAAIPMGVLADRLHRARLLAVVIAVWAVAMVAGGLAPDYEWLLASRLLLGAAVAASGPVVVSLTGDFIPPADRAAVLGWILTGEIAGAGAGLLVGGEIAATFSWRYAFFLLAAASLALAVSVWRQLPEPARGGAGWLPGDPREDGAGERAAPEGAAASDGAGTSGGAGEGGPEGGGARPGGGGGRQVDQARAVVDAWGIRPAPERVLRPEDEEMSLLRATVFLLRIPSNRLLIIASATGYFFFAGLRTFVVVFAIRHFHVSQLGLGVLIVVIGVAALVGAVAGGRFTDRALRRGRTEARILVPAAGFTLAALLLLPGFVLTPLALALPAIVLGTAALAAANPPLDAARLDIVPASMWGRAESLRTVLRLAAEAVAPATFGLVADVLGDGGGGGTGDRASGLQDAFLIMLLPLLANGLLMLLARRSYPVDVATASAADRAASR
ncbi:MFS transporter [Micromonospora sp. NPDC049559]|uniref:MFS transporter n=1 Tax=Micromonospora sp. NPDC049559 TaxID=3155923 RepID=UPI0034406231